MQKDLVFFKKEGEEGVALTSTSANHIANLAKEYIQGVETQLNNICFFDIRVALVGTLADANIIQTGESSKVLDSLQSLLEGVAQAKSLIAWLREGIKAKENLMKGLQTISLEDWCKENGMVKPETPNYGHVLTEVEYYASLPIKERNRYYQLEINESTNKVNTEYMAASQKYQAELKDVLGAFKTWKDEKSQEYSKLKIVVPNSLLGIYNTINSLGK